VSYLQRSLQISFAVHAFAVLLLIFMGDRFVSSEKILVIDFTLEDTAGANHAGNRAAVKTQTRDRNGQQKEVEKKPNLEAAEPAAEIVPHAVPPVTVSARESPTAEIQMPVSAHSETRATSAASEQDSASKGITRVSSASTVAGNMNGEPARGHDNVADAGRMKYLKANFSYIKELINRHIIYPKTARQMGWQGKVKVSFFISSDGHAEDIKIAQSSGIRSLDKNAIDAVKSASPFPKPPVEAQIIIPIFYQLH
jgi:periplasmic protein TonB